MIRIAAEFIGFVILAILLVVGTNRVIKILQKNNR